MVRYACTQANRWRYHLILHYFFTNSCTIHVATTGHSRKLKTPIGAFEFFQLKPEMMKEGIEWCETRVPFLMATPEKALLDIYYITTRKKKRFSSLPELDIDSSSFKVRKFNALV